MMKTFAVTLLLATGFISCSNGKEEGTTEIHELKNIEPREEKKIETKSVARDSIIKILQGEWKETEYPFRRIHFKNSMVKFIEEGMAEELKFKVFQISNQCPFEVNNIKNASSNDIFLIIPGTGSCEILKSFGDTLTLSGFSTNTRSNYNIVYRKVD